jgi:predicted dehydrogenase
MTIRRNFLKTLALPTAAGLPTIVKASALGRNGAVAPSDRITLATIGVGWMGDGHLDEFLKCTGVQLVAVCDLDDHHLTAGKAKVDTFYGDQGCGAYRAYDEVLGRRDIDAVSIAVPDHWHGIVAVCAARSGKDIYCEKPLAHSFNEGLAMVQAYKANSRMWQTGSWQRSKENFRKGCELVRNGYIGKVHTVEVGLPAGHYDFAKTKDETKTEPPPAYLWYERWLGPAPEAPYCPARVHKNWRWNYDYGGGQLMDWVGHHVDIAHWGLGLDESAPETVEGVGVLPPRDALWNTATTYKVTCKYPNGITMVMAGGYKEIESGTKWIGDKGWLQVDRGKIACSDESLLTADLKFAIPYPKSPGHYQEFIDSVKSRKPTLTPAEVALHSATPGWLGNISIITGRKITWDAAKMEIVGDPEASKMLGPKMREPWQLNRT